MLASTSGQPILDAGLLAGNSGNQLLLQDFKDRIYSGARGRRNGVIGVLCSLNGCKDTKYFWHQ